MQWCWFFVDICQQILSLKKEKEIENEIKITRFFKFRNILELIISRLHHEIEAKLITWQVFCLLNFRLHHSRLADHSDYIKSSTSLTQSRVCVGLLRISVSKTAPYVYIVFFKSVISSSFVAYPSIVLINNNLKGKKVVKKMSEEEVNVESLDPSGRNEEMVTTPLIQQEEPPVVKLLRESGTKYE